MASITVRNLDDDVKTRLRARATGNGRSLEEETRSILREATVVRTSPDRLERGNPPGAGRQRPCGNRRGQGTAPARAVPISATAASACPSG